MNKKSFIWGVVAGIVLSFVAHFVIDLVNQNTDNNYSVHHFEKSISYENKTEASFMVFQVIDNSALAREYSGYRRYNGKIVLLLGENFYSDQEVTVKNPQMVGTFSYTSRNEQDMTVPIINGDME